MELSVFVRNDDVRGELDDSLVRLSETLLKNNVLLIHAVEPKNVSIEVANWLLEIKNANPEKIAIIQHGFDHTLKTPLPYRGEFGGGRPLEKQKAEIHEGKQLMNMHFGNQWNPIFSFPFGEYDKNTLKALVSEGYRCISTGIRFTWKRHILNLIGRSIKAKNLAGKNITYFNEKIPNIELIEYPIVLNNTKKYTLPDSGIQKDSLELINEWRTLPRFIKCRGVLTHHRFNSSQDIKELSNFFIKLCSMGVSFPTFKEIFCGKKMDNK